MLDQHGTDLLVKSRNEGWDERRRYEYPLRVGAEIWDVGAWRGDFTSEMRGRYICAVRMFEILPRSRSNLAHWFAHDPNVTVEPYGLGAADEERTIRDTNECTSAFITGDTKVTIRRASDILTAAIDLLKLNVEGAEYDILADLLDAQKLPLVEFLQVQFHDILTVDGIYVELPGAHDRYRQISERLAETHTLQWRQPWVWESWARKDGIST